MSADLDRCRMDRANRSYRVSGRAPFVRLSPERCLSRHTRHHGRPPARVLDLLFSDVTTTIRTKEPFSCGRCFPQQRWLLHFPIERATISLKCSFLLHRYKQWSLPLYEPSSNMFDTISSQRFQQIIDIARAWFCLGDLIHQGPS
jgi:hypothetical protein